jgi:glycosyltransferase involved in cell wall biosynthesis
VIANPIALFDPYDVAAMAEKLKAVLDDKAMADGLRVHGLRRARDFSWVRAANELLDAFEAATAKREATRTGPSGDMLLRVLNAIRPHTGALDGTELCALSRMIDETFRPTGRPCIYLDVSTVVSLDDRSGIQRVTRAIATEMLGNVPASHDVEIVYSNPQEDAFYVANHYKHTVLGFDAPRSDEYVVFKPGDILIFLDQAPRMAINHAPYIKYLRGIGVRVYFYVHDILPLHQPQWFSAGGVEEFGELMETVATADGALCNSLATANDVKAYVTNRLKDKRRPFTIAYSHLGTDVENSAPSSGLPADAPAILAQFAQRPTFLMIGTIEPRKGHRQTLQAFERLWKQGVDANLVIVGRWGWKMENFDTELRTHREAGRRLFWLQSISDEYLLKVYKASDCMIAASQGEGFGLPLIEAAQHGLPVIARDIPVFREVAQDHALYFSDDVDPDIIADVVQCWLKNDREGLTIASTGMRMSSWRQSVAGMLDALLADNWTYTVAPPREDAHKG